MHQGHARSVLSGRVTTSARALPIEEGVAANLRLNLSLFHFPLSRPILATKDHGILTIHPCFQIDLRYILELFWYGLGFSNKSRNQGLHCILSSAY